MSPTEFVTTDFTLLRPWWLLALPGVIPLIAWLRQWHMDSAWRRYIPAEKLKHLQIHADKGRNYSRFLIPGCWILACIALSGPSWQHTPLPVNQNRDALVVLFDLSPSMSAKDISPDRITRARLKLIDLLRLRTEGETALIAWSGDAHRVSPLTDDTENIITLLPALSPAIMPVAGSNPEAAVTMGLDLIKGAGLTRGEFLFITDGITEDARQTIRQLVPAEIRVSVLAVGTPQGAPIPHPISGGFMRDADGQIIIAGMRADQLREIADNHAGRFVELTATDEDIVALMAPRAPGLDSEYSARDDDTRFDTRDDGGFWLMLLLLPLAVFAFRRNVLFAVALVTVPVLLPSENAHAFEWQDLWQRPDQQAAKALETGEAARATELFRNQQWRGVARYRAGDYDGAVQEFAGETTTQSIYNRANALALAGDLEQAVTAYDEVLRARPDDENAQHNRDVIKKLLEQQQQQQQKDQEQNQGNEESESDAQKGDDSAQDEEQKGERQSGEEESEENEQEKSSESEKAANPESANENLSDLSEQWLRKIESDPGGLLRRKFDYEARQRAAEGNMPEQSRGRY